MDQTVARLVSAQILRFNADHLKVLAVKDPDHQPPKGFCKLRVLRTVVGWHAAQKSDRALGQLLVLWESERHLRVNYRSSFKPSKGGAG